MLRHARPNSKLQHRDHKLQHQRPESKIQHRDHKLQHLRHSISRGKKTDKVLIKDVSPVELDTGGSSSVTLAAQKSPTHTPNSKIQHRDHKLQHQRAASIGERRYTSRMSVLLSWLGNTPACPSHVWIPNDGSKALRWHPCKINRGV